MQSLQIQDVRAFMAALLTGHSFDTFLLTEGSVTTFATFIIDGTIKPDYYDTDEAEEARKAGYARWQLIRPHVMDLIRGKKSPLRMKFVFRLADYNIEELIRTQGLSVKASDVAGLYLNIIYEQGHVTCTTGSSLRVFSLDKTLDRTWDEMVQKLLKREKLPFIIV